MGSFVDIRNDSASREVASDAFPHVRNNREYSEASLRESCPGILCLRILETLYGNHRGQQQLSLLRLG